MSEKRIQVALDAMGGDNAPQAPIKGAIDAIQESNEVDIICLGKEEEIKAELAKYTYDTNRIQIVNCTEVIETAEHPVNAIRSKKDSSIVKGMMMVRNGECDAFVSAGSTGAVLVGGQILVGRVKGVERPPLAPVIPTEEGCALLLDCGANVDAKASNLIQFARMGSLYMENVMGVKNPRVALLNIGAEEEKGNALVRETMPLLRECKDLNFIGSIEARDVPYGGADVIVTEAFAGNVCLKMYEGVGSFLLKQIKGTLMSSLVTKLGALLIKGALKKTLKRFDLDQYGGAPMLGLKGLVVKTHGSANHKEVKNTILQCIAFSKQSLPEKIERAVAAAE